MKISPLLPCDERLERGCWNLLSNYLISMLLLRSTWVSRPQARYREGYRAFFYPCLSSYRAVLDNADIQTDYSNYERSSTRLEKERQSCLLTTLVSIPSYLYLSLPVPLPCPCHFRSLPRSLCLFPLPSPINPSFYARRHTPHVPFLLRSEEHHFCPSRYARSPKPS
jgi:hypothetical protein